LELNTGNLHAAERLVMKFTINTMDAPPSCFEAVNKLEGFIFPGE